MKTGDATTVAKKLERIPRSLGICTQVARALVDTGQEWSTSGWLRRFFRSTDYERARSRVLKELRMTEAELRTLRASEFSPEAIHGTAHVVKVMNACRQCPQAIALDAQHLDGSERRER